MTIIRLYDSHTFNNFKSSELFVKLKSLSNTVDVLNTELCYHVELEKGSAGLNENQKNLLKWILGSPFHKNSLQDVTKFSSLAKNQGIIECGPRFNFSTPDSSNAVQICHNIGLTMIVRVETSKRYLITLSKGQEFTQQTFEKLSPILYDRMTHCVYTKENLPVNSFDERLPLHSENWFTVPILENGAKALSDVNEKLGLAFDDWDLDFYTKLFRDKLKRNPTSVECFDLAQSNSEHSRHWFFKGKLIVDGEEWDKSLIDLIMDTQKFSNNNNVIKFSDNSSAIKGFTHKSINPSSVIAGSKMENKLLNSDIIFTAETHNMPTGVAPFSGATTGTGGRIRDVQAVGRGGHTIAGTAGYSVGNLNIPDYDLPWEDDVWSYPKNFASPLDIIIEASNGASDYGNKFGEPVIIGFVNSYGLKNATGVREEFVKPIMFSGGIGYMPDDMIEKAKPSPGMCVVKIGGPVYRIGVGGGAASSVAVQGDSKRSTALDFGAVQRGDAEMGNRLNRVVRACLEAPANPILSIHDQGAGGNGNVLKELVEPEGALIFTKEFQLGDPTINVMELWGAEYQESNALLCHPDHKNTLRNICKRERCPVSFVGEVTGDGRVKLIEDSIENIQKYKNNSPTKLPFDLDLDAVLGKMPRKEFKLEKKNTTLKPLTIPIEKLTVDNVLNRVLRLVAVGSKRYLTNKVDRCVTGLIAQQQCVGPLHTPLSDYAVISLSHFGTVGAATSIGTQCMKGMIDPEIGARMTVAEALTNLCFVKISSINDIKCSGNWMWSGKTGEDGRNLAQACKAMCSVMSQLGIAVDGGKDSLSMTASVDGEKVKSPGTLVVSTYAPCPDITVKVQPALLKENSQLIWVPINSGKYRLGGTALAQCFKQQGDMAPDLDDPLKLKEVFNTTQKLVSENMILSGHDISDGGFITCILEMAFAGLRGIDISINLKGVNWIEALFNEEPGLVLEVDRKNVTRCIEEYKSKGLECHNIGTTKSYGMDSMVNVTFNNNVVLNKSLHYLLEMWEETSYRLELLQANPQCVNEEWKGLKNRSGPKYDVKFSIDSDIRKISSSVKVAVIREEGTNGDREMIASLMKANFDVFDVTMYDLIQRNVTLDKFQGIVFPGGFSYADTLGSAKGWAANILFNNKLKDQFDHFAFTRKDTFSLGVCNGCQLMALLGWLERKELNCTDETTPQIILDHNTSGRFECRWSCVSINQSMSSNLWFKGMESSKLGVWVAHGEGKFTFRDLATKEAIKNGGQICMQYLDDNGKATTAYPMNPNGSEDGIAGLCSKDGRHLAMMPHPERCILNWQCPYPMVEAADPKSSSPWQKIFYNAYQWSSQKLEESN